MGAGVYLPRDEDYRCKMIDLGMMVDEGLEEWEYCSDYDMLYFNLKLAIENLLPDSFWKEDKQDPVNSDARIYWANHLLKVSMASWQTDEVIIVAPHDFESEERRLRNFAFQHMHKVADKLFDGLVARSYELRVRTGSWTTGRYIPTSERIPA